MCRRLRLRTTNRARQDLITFIAVAALAAVALLVPTAAKADAGQLDPAFGNGGFTPGSGVSDVKLDSQGRIVAGAGGNAASRFTPEGQPDPSFSDDGLAFVTGLGVYEQTGVAVDGADRVIVAGYRFINDPQPNRAQGLLFRFTADGELDSDFGGDGIVTTGDRLPSDVDARPDGRIVISTHLWHIWETEHPQASPRFVFMQLAQDGSPDPTFGQNGVAAVEAPLDYRRANLTDVLLGPGGKVLGLGGGYLFRLEADGDPDPTLDAGGPPSGGHVPANAEELTVDDSGRILLTGTILSNGNTGSQVSFVTRLLDDGSADGDFDDDGTAVVDVAPARDYPTGIDIQDDGKVVFGGNSSTYDSPQWVFVARLDDEGSLDDSFAGDGSVAVVDVPASRQGLTIDADGGILLATGCGVARFLGDGPPQAAGTPWAQGCSGSPDPPDPDAGGAGGDGDVAGGVATKGGKVGLQVHRVVVPKTAAAMARRGIRVLASCTELCKLVVSVELSDGVANRLGLARTRIAKGNSSAAANKRRWVVARLTPAAAEALRTYDGGGRLQIRVRAVGAAGAQSATAVVAG